MRSLDNSLTGHYEELMGIVAGTLVQFRKHFNVLTTRHVGGRLRQFSSFIVHFFIRVPLLNRFIKRATRTARRYRSRWRVLKYT